MLDIEKFDLMMKKAKEITKDDIKVREIIEICSNKSVDIDYNFLNSINYRQLFLVYREIYKKPLDSKEIIKDMINGQYLIENLSYIKVSDIYDDEEIY